MKHAPLEIVKDRIARLLLQPSTEVTATLGTITLRPRQRDAAERLVSLVQRHGGAMLAEPVGLGKTFTALAAAARFDGPITVVVPSSLRAMWRDALDRCGLTAQLLTHEALSRGLVVDPVNGLVIVDEAHRVRSPATRRYGALAELCRGARVLLLTATPLQNRRRDLAAQLALYLGHRAWESGDEDLAAHVVRGAPDDSQRIPHLDGPHLVELRSDDDILDRILALPPPLPARDESVAQALLVYGLLHQWASSRAALVAALKRRRARGVALLEALGSGRYPTRAELSAWTYADESVQLAFPELIAPAAAPSSETSAALDLDELTTAVDRHDAAITALLERLRRPPDPDDDRASMLRRIRSAHAHERIIAFCQYAETVEVLRRRLINDPGVATLTARGGRVAGGAISRTALLAQFVPRGDAEDVGPAERVDLLLTTDLLSEGLNLQEASVIVHLDLPWNPARLDQRVGRARRLGSRFERVTVYTFAPPASAERLLRIERRLREKLATAHRTVGVAGGILPHAFGIDRHDLGIAEQQSAVERVLRGWLSADSARQRERSGDQCHGDSGPLVAGAASLQRGFVGALHDHRGPMLVADLGAGLSTAPREVLSALRLVDESTATTSASQTGEACARIHEWLANRRAADVIDLGTAAAARSRRTTLARLATVLSRAPRHRRAQLAPLADAAREAIAAPLGAGAERVLERLARAELPDEAWLRSIATFAALNAHPTAARRTMPDAGGAVLDAVILLEPTAL